MMYITSRAYWIFITLTLIILPSLNVAYAQRLKSTGKIHNTGKIIIKGNASFAQDSLEGTIEFSQNNNSFNQYIPQIKYEKLLLKGTTPKILRDTTKSIIVEKEFFSDKETVIKFNNRINFESKGKTAHYGIINPSYLFGNFVLNGNHIQHLEGTGSYRNLTLNNKNNAIISNGGGFEISNELVLKNGVLLNSENNNFIIAENASIFRYPNGSLAYYPKINGKYSVVYKGNDLIKTGYEISKEDTLSSLSVMNEKGIELTQDIYVKDSLSLVSNIVAHSKNKEFVVNYFSQKNPTFLNSKAEIIGLFRRYNLNNAYNNIFNNSYTYLNFNGNSIDSIQYVEVLVIPSSEPLYHHPKAVQRRIRLKAKNIDSLELATMPSFTFGYGWRHTDENKNLNNSKLVLQRYSKDHWFYYDNSSSPHIEDDWAFANAQNIYKTGEFAIGMPLPQAIEINAKLFLEGAFMKNKMIKRKLPDLEILSDFHPYNLIDVLPEMINNAESYSDYIVLEIKSRNSNQNPLYKPAFLSDKGEVKDIITGENIRIPFEELAPGEYYVAVLHHNHLDIIAEKPILISQGNNILNADFTKPDFLLGKEYALKPVAMEEGNIIWAMIAGDIDSNNIIDNTDLELLFNDLGSNSFIRNVNGLGLINTNDYNYIWNNLGRKSSLIK